MDEFRKLPDEFSLPQDEFNQDLNTNIKPKIENKRKEKNIIKYLCASSAVLLVLPTYFNVFDMPENKIKEEPVIIENNNNQNNQNNSDVNSNDNIDNEPTNNTEVNNQDEEIVNTIFVKVDCEVCEGTGIICPGDPEFGYDRGNGYGYEGCHGTGYSPCPDIWCHDGIKTCQSCKGSGVYKGQTCVVCRGAGIVDCEFCNNTGIAKCISENSHAICEKCNGEGYYMEERIVE